MRTRSRAKKQFEEPVPLTGKRPKWNKNYRDQVLKDFGYDGNDSDSEEEDLRSTIKKMIKNANLTKNEILRMTTTNADSDSDEEEILSTLKKMVKDANLTKKEILSMTTEADEGDDAVRAMEENDKNETLLSMIFPWSLLMAVTYIFLQNHVQSDVIFIVVSVIAAIRFLHHVSVIYGNIKGWQITILTMHVSPVIIMKTCFSSLSLPAYAVMIAFQLAMEMPLNIFTSIYLVAQIVTLHLHDIAPQRVEDVLIVLNVIIPSGFWAAVLFSGLFGDKQDA